MNRVASDLLRFAFIDEKGGKGPGFRTRREKLGREDSMLGSPSAGPGGREVFPARFFLNAIAAFFAASTTASTVCRLAMAG